jgi:ATP-dependent Lon protease
MQPITKTLVEYDESPDPTDTWTGDYALSRFDLPAGVKDSLHERLEALADQAHARRLQQRDERLAKANEEKANKSASSALTWKEPIDPASATHPLLKIFSREDVEALFAAEKDGTRSCEVMDTKRAEALCRRLAAGGEYRRLGQLPVDWKTQLDSIEEQFPNFGAVIHYLRAMFNLAMLAPASSMKHRVADLDPILIDGPPGVGKSYFCQSLAEMLGVPFRRHDFGSMQTNGELVGSDVMWSNAKMGGVFKVLTEQEFGNPVLLLDEIDKTHKDQRYSPDTALLSLLERSTSTRFHDLSIPDVPVNASHIYWIATSNEKARIAAPLRSRFRTFEVGPIPKEHSRNFVLKVLGEVAEEMQVNCVRVLRTNVVDLAATLSPRVLRSVLREALAYTMLDGRRAITERDLHCAIQANGNRSTARIGF